MKNLVKKASITLMASIITLGSAPHIVLGTYEDMDNYTAYDTEAYYLSDTENMYYEDGVLNDYISYDVEVHYYRYPLSEDPYHEDVSISFEEELELVRNDPTMTEEERAEVIARILILQYEWTIDQDVNILPYEARFLAKQVLTSIDARQRRRDGTPIVLNVPPLRQIQNNWCGPATALQTVTFINRAAANNWTQATIARNIGVTAEGIHLGAMVDFVNRNNGSAARYTEPRRLTTANAINSNIISAMHSRRTPMIRVETPAAANWPYRLNSGHFLNVSAVQPTSDGFTAAHIRLTDPWYFTHWVPSRPNARGEHWVTLSQLTAAMTIGRNLYNFSS